MFRHYDFKRYDYLLIINVLILVIIGIIAIGSATQINTDLGSDTYVKKQIIGLVIGFILMIGVSIIDYHFISKFYPIIYISINVGGATRWVDIGGFSIQPSEFAKLLIILVMAKLIDKYHTNFNKPWFLLMLAILAGVVIALVNIQPDLSTSVMITIIFLVTLFIGGLDYRYILVGLVIIIPVFIIGFNLIKDPNQTIIEDYQRNRIMTLISPENADPADKLQTENSIQAIGSGQMNGKGLYQGKLNQYNYLPEPQTDFIFSIIGEEFGFVGCSVIIGLILLLLLQCLWVARTSRDYLAKIIIGGIVGMIGIQTYVNVGVVTGMLPNTGLPLPFISAGISSLLTNMVAIGFVLNISMQRKSINE